ncbi:transposase [Streptomyces asiaticus]|uniref:transposase n=1 Tax=Streptomyces sp. NPDC059455 TaxID=3346837 RepID=UPI00369A4F4D
MNCGSWALRCRRFAARPQGGGIAPWDERAVFTAVVYVLTSGCGRRYLPPTFGTSPATAHRRFAVWTEADLWRRLRRADSAPGARWTGSGDRRHSVRPGERDPTDQAEPV